MPFLSFAMAWMGYTLLTWGVATVRGCNVTFMEVAWPGKYVGCDPDAPGTAVPAGSAEAKANAAINSTNTYATQAEAQTALKNVQKAAPQSGGTVYKNANGKYSVIFG